MSDTGVEAEQVAEVPPPRRARGNPAIALRIRPDEVSLLNARCRLEGVNRSELIRRFLAFGVLNMPAGWRP
jgi:hypothetical protein